MDLTRREPAPRVDLVQDDRYSRNLEIGLHVNGIPFPVPEDCQVLIRYRKRDGVGGVYDSMPDGSKAWEIAENRVIVKIAPQVCTVGGDVALTVTLVKGDAVLSCFEICLQIQEVSCRQMHSEPYIHIRKCLPQPASAKKGDYLRVAEVNSQGQVTALEGVAAVAGDGISDWNAAEGQPGHVLNRTHWVEDNGFVEIIPETTLTTTEDSPGEFDVPDGVFVIEAGKTYVITYNGTEYTCVAADGGTVLPDLVGMQVGMIGNYAMALGKGDTGEPFVAIYAPGEGTQIMDLNGALSITATVSVLDETVHKIDPKFLPEGIGGGIFTVTVTEDGSGGYTADKTIEQLDAAYQSGMALQCVCTIHSTPSILPMRVGIPGVGYGFNGDVGVGAESVQMADVLMMTGSNPEVRVKSCLMEGANVSNPYTLYFRNAMYSDTKNVTSAYKFGSFSYNGSSAYYVKGLPNPYALIINGIVYNGSEEKDLTEAINALIDTKLSSLTSAEEVSF